MKKRILLLSCLLGILVLYSDCRKTDESFMPQSVPVAPDELMGPELEQFFDSMTVADITTVGPESIILPNGRTIKDFTDEHFPELFTPHRGGSPFELGPALMKATEDKGPQTAKMLIISALYASSNALSGYGPMPNGQPKLAYVWGSKNLSKPRIGVDYKDDNGVMQPAKCQVPKYGLDCSGFIARVFEGAQIYLPDGPAATQADPDLLKKALDQKFKDKSAKIEVKAIEKLPGKSADVIKDIESGDLIAFYSYSKKLKAYTNTISHIGWAFRKENSDDIIIFNSYGGPSQTCDVNLSKGPTAMVASEAIKKWPKLRIIRYTIDISGEWELAGRCVSQSEDRLFLNLNFSQASGGNNSFTASGNGVDYDGSTQFTARISGSYNPLKSTIENCQIQFQFPNHTRIDNFPTISLAGIDETDYIPATCIANCGCDLKVKFKNKSR